MHLAKQIFRIEDRMSNFVRPTPKISSWKGHLSRHPDRSTSLTAKCGSVCLDKGNPDVGLAVPDGLVHGRDNHTAVKSGLSSLFKPLLDAQYKGGGSRTHGGGGLKCKEAPDSNKEN